MRGKRGIFADKFVESTNRISSHKSCESKESCS